MQDRRIMKTKNSIKKTFLALIEKKPLEKITVLEVCKIADIGRGTFYLHYHDIYDLYQQLENEVLDIFSINISNNKYTLEQKIEYIVGYYLENKSLVLAIISTNRWINIIKNIFQKDILEAYYDSHDSYNNIESHFIAYGLCGVIEETIKNTIIIDKDELTLIIVTIINKFIAGYHLQPNAKIN